MHNDRMQIALITADIVWLLVLIVVFAGASRAILVPMRTERDSVNDFKQRESREKDACDDKSKFSDRLRFRLTTQNEDGSTQASKCSRDLHGWFVSLFVASSTAFAYLAVESPGKPILGSLFFPGWVPLLLYVTASIAVFAIKDADTYFAKEPVGVSAKVDVLCGIIFSLVLTFCGAGLSAWLFFDNSYPGVILSLIVGAGNAAISQWFFNLKN